jgi:hypothetical protein
MKRAILEVDDEHKCTNAGTPSSSTIRKALPGLKARFQRAPAAVSCTSYNRNASSGPPTTVLLFRPHKKDSCIYSNMSASYTYTSHNNKVLQTLNVNSFKSTRIKIARQFDSKDNQIPTILKDHNSKLWDEERREWKLKRSQIE